MSKVFVAVIEDHEGCGEITMSVHATLEGATQALREKVESEYRGYDEFEDEDVSEMDADEIQELIDEVFGKTAKVEEHSVRS